MTGLAFLSMCSFLLVGNLYADGSVNPVDSSQIDVYQNVLKEAGKEIDQQYKMFFENREKIRNTYIEIFALAKRQDELWPKLWGDKKITDVAKKSVVKKEYDDNDERLKAFTTGIIDEMGLPVFDLMSILSKKEKKTKRPRHSLTGKEIDSMISLVSKEGLRDKGVHFNPSCVKPGLVEDPKCLETSIRFCSSTFSSEGKKLSHEVLDEELRVTKKTFTNSDEIEEFLRSTQKFDDAKNKFSLLITKVTGAMCGLIAEKGYSFEQKEINYSEYRAPEWFKNLQYAHVYAIDDFNKYCLPTNSERRAQLRRLSHTSNLDGFIKTDIEKGLSTLTKVCDKFIERVCDDFEVVGGSTLARHYVTVGCEVRTLTLDDLNRDIAEWRGAGMTDADIKKHGEMAQTFRLCQQSIENGYSWVFKKPKLTCNPKSTKRR